MIRNRLPQFVAGVALVAAGSFIASALVGHDAHAQEQDQLGLEVYQTQCESCHGQGGEGDGPAARFLETQPRDLTAGSWMYVESISQAEVERVIKDGITDTEMEPFGELLLEEEITAVAEYVLANFVPSESW